MTCIRYGLRSRFEFPWCFNEASDPLVFPLLEVLEDLISSPPMPSLISLQLFTWFVQEWSTPALKIIISWILFSVSSCTMDSFVYVASYGHGGFKVVVVTLLLIVLQFLVVGGRFTSRRLREVSLGIDDYVLLLATALTFGLCALAIACKLV